MCASMLVMLLVYGYAVHGSIGENMNRSPLVASPTKSTDVKITDDQRTDRRASISRNEELMLFDPDDGQRHTCDDMYYEMSGLQTIQSNPYESLSHEDSVRGSVTAGGYTYYSVCVAQHKTHHHNIKITLHSLNGDADMYMSSHINLPKSDHHTWNSAKSSAEEHITLRTNLFDWDQTSKFLFIGVRGSPRFGTTEYIIQVEVVSGDARKRRERLRGSHTAMVNWDKAYA